MDWGDGLLVVAAEVCLGREPAGLEAEVCGVDCPCDTGHRPGDGTEPAGEGAPADSLVFSSE